MVAALLVAYRLVRSGRRPRPGSRATSYPAIPGTSAVACPSKVRCYRGGREQFRVRRHPDHHRRRQSWTLLPLPAGTGVLTAVACPSTTHCYAEGADPSGENGMILATTDAGKEWTTQMVAPGITGLDSLSCPSVTRCFSVGENTVGRIQFSLHHHRLGAVVVHPPPSHRV